MENTSNIRSKLDISFENLCYSVPEGRNEKRILKNINGYYKSGNITAIIGPSGGGKTTLLNILAGYITSDISGTIKINGKKRDLDKFYKLSRYIMEDMHLTSFLTVVECMHFASKFKFGSFISKEESQIMIEKSLEELHLQNCQYTLTNNLSSGEKKRLVIALELLDCPSIIFLDEPTTGLDEHNSYECVSLLKKLTKQGISVVTTIHTPSPKVLGKFDHVYGIAEGQCVYQGAGSGIVPFLKEIQLHCPLHYNPIDFLIEVSSHAYGNFIDKLEELTDNGASTYTEANLKISTRDIIPNNDDFPEIINYNCSFKTQFVTLLHRSLMQAKRNINTYNLQMCATIFVTAVMTTFFYKCGDDGNMIKSNAFFLMLSMLYFVYATMIPVLSNTPLEMNIIRSEYFNKWYDVSPYFLALSVQVIPFMLVTCGIYILISYPLTDQPIDFIRILQFFFICVLVTMITDALCQIIGIMFDPVNSLFLGVCIIKPIGLFAIQSIGHNIKYLPIVYQYLIKLSFMRLALEGLVHTVYDDRENINCPNDELFCPFSTGEQVMKNFGYGNSNLWTSVISLIFFYMLFKAIAFYTLTICIKPQMTTSKLLRFRKFLQIKFNIKQ